VARSTATDCCRNSLWLVTDECQRASINIFARPRESKGSYPRICAMGISRSVSLCNIRRNLISSRAPGRQSPFPTAKRMALGHGVLCAAGKWRSFDRLDTAIATVGATLARNPICCSDGHCAPLRKLLNVVHERGLPLTHHRAWSLTIGSSDGSDAAKRPLTKDRKGSRVCENANNFGSLEFPSSE
jgi:hypothetical protein